MYESLVAVIGWPLAAVTFLFGASWLWCMSIGFVGGRCLSPRPAYGPLIGIIWDPSPETQYQILSLELAAESVKLEPEDARLTTVVDPTESR